VDTAYPRGMILTDIMATLLPQITGLSTVIRAAADDGDLDNMALRHALDVLCEYTAAAAKLWEQHRQQERR
jgi:hypothetical protein